MKLANINPKLLATSLDGVILPTILFILVCIGIITIPAVGTTEPYTGRIPSLDNIKANANSSASKILNFLLQNAHLFKTKEQIDAEQWAWIFENLRNYSESSSGITEGQNGSEDPGDSTNEGSGSKRNSLLNSAQNDKLKNAINEIYRPGATIGDGGLADAVRHELTTGELVGGKSHLLKAAERVTNLENIIKKQSLNQSDLDIATELLNDLKNALGGK